MNQAILTVTSPDPLPNDRFLEFHRRNFKGGCSALQKLTKTISVLTLYNSFEN